MKSFNVACHNHCIYSNSSRHFKIARDVNAATYDTFSAFGIAAVLYAVLAFILIWIFRKLEKRWLAF